MKQKCTQFKCGIRGYLDEKSPFAISVGDIPKQFAYGYTKAVQQEGSHMLVPLSYAVEVK